MMMVRTRAALTEAMRRLGQRPRWTGRRHPQKPDGQLQRDQFWDRARSPVPGPGEACRAIRIRGLWVRTGSRPGIARSAAAEVTYGRRRRTGISHVDGCHGGYPAADHDDAATSPAVSSTEPVPETRLMAEVELSPDQAWRALRRYGGWHLVRDAFLRFRYGDGFSHARALGLQLCLAAVPLLIAMQGLATKLSPRQGGRVLAETALALTPGVSDSLVGDLLANDERMQDLGEVALTLGLITALVALTAAVGQMERGANRIYGTQRDRPFVRKYACALVLAIAAGVPALMSFLMLVAGGALGASMARTYHWSGTATATWNMLRWPASLALTVVTVSVLFRFTPRRRQPGMSWVMIGGAVATALWWLVSLLLASYISWSGVVGDTYGPLTAVMALLLWANLTGIALFLGLALAAQLEARRVGVPEPAVPDQWKPVGRPAAADEHARVQTLLAGGPRQDRTG
jgi:YihY family inner membrane protein